MLIRRVPPVADSTARPPGQATRISSAPTMSEALGSTDIQSQAETSRLFPCVSDDLATGYHPLATRSLRQAGASDWRRRSAFRKRRPPHFSLKIGNRSALLQRQRQVALASPPAASRWQAWLVVLAHYPGCSGNSPPEYRSRNLFGFQGDTSSLVKLPSVFSLNEDLRPIFQWEQK